MSETGMVREIRKRYSRKNRPESIECAEETLAELEIEISLVETKLEHKDDLDFDSESEYESWRRRAMAALAHMRREQTYLENWLASKEQEQKAQERKSAQAAVALEIERSPEVLQFEKDIQAKEDYYSEELLQLQDRLAAMPAESDPQRRTSIAELKHRISVDQQQFRQRCSGLRLTKAQWEKFRQPLAKLLTNLEKLLRGGRQPDREQEGDLPSNWKQCCVAAIERGVAHGVVLTDEETLVLNLLKFYMRRNELKKAAQQS